MNAEMLRRAAEEIRSGQEQFSPGYEDRFELAVADLLDNAAEDEEMLREGGDLGPLHDTFMRRMSHQKALAVARAYLGEPS